MNFHHGFPSLIALIAILLSPLESSSQEANSPLAGGWTHRRDAGSFTVESVACTQNKAFIQSWRGEIRQWDGTSWTELPRVPGSADGREMWASPEGHIFTYSGEHVAEWNGSSWSMHRVPDWPGELTGIWARSKHQVYLVGRGRVAYRDGGSFKNYSAGTWRDLDAIWGFGKRELWIGGQEGTIHHHDGESWTRQETKTTAWIKGIWGASNDDIWAWGADWNREKGWSYEALHWDGRLWTSRSNGITDHIRHIGGVSPGNIYAVGNFGIAHFADSRWTQEVTPAMVGQSWRYMSGICATKRHVVVGYSGGGALVRAL